MATIDQLSSFMGDKKKLYYLSKRICISLPPFVNSNGIWEYIEGLRHPLEASLPRLEFQIVAVFSITQAVHFVLKRLGFSMFVSQAGLILRQALFLHPPFKHIIFSYSSLTVVDMAASFGYMLFQFLVGVKMDVSMIHRTGKKTLITALLSIIIPLLLGLGALATLSNYYRLNIDDKLELLEVSVIHSLCSFPVIACLIDDLQIINSELGRLGLSCALVSEIVSSVLLRSAIWITRLYTLSFRRALIDLGLITAFMLTVVFAIRPAMLWIVKQTPEGKPVKSLYIHYIIMLAVGSGLASHLFGQYISFGPFVLGLAVPDGPPLGSSLVDKLDPVVSGILIPLTVTTCAMRLNLLNTINFDNSLMKSTAIVIAIITLAKFATSLAPPLFCKVPKRDAVALGLIMSCKGIVELTTYTTIRDYGIITEKIFNFLFVTILVTAIIVPFLVKFLYHPSRKYAGYQRRNIMQSKAKGLQILTCIYRPDNIPAIINFLQASCPSRGSPVAVYVLHLINLHGQAAPLFISHKLQTKSVSNRSYSENVILSFRCFEEKNRKSVYVNPFTAISPPKFMHEDICMLALDKLASIVVLPFHRTWFIDGSIESEDNAKRALNRCVLERAPCSVGILADRGYLGQLTSKNLSLESSFCVAMIFFGGSDDCEALTLAKLMSQNDSIRLTVVRFLPKTAEIGTDWNKVLDSEVLKDIKPENNSNKRVEYVVETVEDGQETLSKIQSIAGKYDLIIVGRRNNIETQQTSGLDKSRKFPELGIVGNFLVTADLPRRFSVLVVQQQTTVQ